MYQDDDDFDENLKRLTKTLSEYVDEKTYRVRVLIEMLTHLLLGTTKISEAEVLALVVSIYQDRTSKLKTSWYFPTRAFAIQSRWISIVTETEDLAQTLCLVSNSPMRMKTLPQYFDFSYVVLSSMCFDRITFIDTATHSHVHEHRYFADLNSSWPEIYAICCMNSRKNEKVIQSMREVRVSEDLCVGDVVKRLSHRCHKGRVGSSSSTSRRKKGGSDGSSVRKQDAPTNMFSLLTL